jgi:hypothetical protein
MLPNGLHRLRVHLLIQAQDHELMRDTTYSIRRERCTYAFTSAVASSAIIQLENSARDNTGTAPMGFVGEQDIRQGQVTLPGLLCSSCRTKVTDAMF